LIGFVAKRTVGEASRWTVLMRLALDVHDQQRSLAGTAFIEGHDIWRSALTDGLLEVTR
jgi:hypothetical protein